MARRTCDSARLLGTGVYAALCEDKHTMLNGVFKTKIKFLNWVFL